jgi:hypothetical protein
MAVGESSVARERCRRQHPVQSTSAASLDLRAAYDVLYDDIKTVSLSSNLRSLKLGYARVSWFLSRDLGGTVLDPDRMFRPGRFNQSRIRLIGGTSFTTAKSPSIWKARTTSRRGAADQRYRLGYNTQCCGMLLELARRDFDTIDEIEYRFVLNLRGVGTFLDLQGRPQ